MSLTYHDKVAYAQTINVLFDGAVDAYPEQITEEVAMNVDQMILEITECSKTIAEFSFSAFYSFTIAHAVTYAASYAIGQWVEGISLLHELFIKAGATFVDYKVSGYLSSWIANLTSNRKFIGCVYAARVNWRSKIELGLMGL